MLFFYSSNLKLINIVVQKSRRERHSTHSGHKTGSHGVTVDDAEEAAVTHRLQQFGTNTQTEGGRERGGRGLQQRVSVCRDRGEVHSQAVGNKNCRGSFVRRGEKEESGWEQHGYRDSLFKEGGAEEVFIWESGAGQSSWRDTETLDTIISDIQKQAQWE